jgi:hypothetical protein
MGRTAYWETSRSFQGNHTWHDPTYAGLSQRQVLVIAQKGFAARILDLQSPLTGLDDRRRYIAAFKADVQRHGRAVNQSVERVRGFLEAARSVRLPS